MMPLIAKRGCCEEAAIGLGAPIYVPCNKPAVALVWWPKRGEGPYRMCGACADHNVRNRGATLLGEYVELPDPDVTPATHPDHPVVGHEFMGTNWSAAGHPATRWFCESHDRQGYWMYATDGSGRWTNVSERAIGASFHAIHNYDGRLVCPGWHVPQRYADQTTETPKCGSA